MAETVEVPETALVALHVPKSDHQASPSSVPSCESVEGEGVWAGLGGASNQRAARVWRRVRCCGSHLAPLGAESQ